MIVMPNGFMPNDPLPMDNEEVSIIKITSVLLLMEF